MLDVGGAYLDMYPAFEISHIGGAYLTFGMSDVGNAFLMGKAYRIPNV